ncbi:MAG: DUF3696 domain-containing protein [Leptospiraceae bacterium]|nr:DUF3696 domain-containing protein [Leptospiraceae bacterium]MBP6739141.1 DUF3696 domain-containing protein [Leptospiraceae bacterium]
MIKKITIENFKILLKNEFELKKLNILTGINGMGKSSLVQSLLLLRQSYINDKISELKIKGEYTDLGAAKDVLSIDKDIIDNPIFFGIEFDNNQSAEYYFDLLTSSDNDDEERDNYSKAEFLRLNARSKINHDYKQSLFLRDNYFHYLNSDRIGPKVTSDVSSIVTKNKEMGIHGEYSINFLDTYKSEPVNNKYVLHPKTDPGKTTLEHQISYWLNDLLPGTRIQTYNMPEIKKVRATYSINGNEYKPINVGFGLTFVLPIIIALLTIKEGGTVIIENPESHLHPRGQARMADLITRCAASGRQVFVETHSDHIINGLMVSAYEYYKSNKAGDIDIQDTAKILNEDVAIYYFSRKEGNNFSDVDRINLTKNGFVEGNIPPGFFDQFNIDMDRLLT